MNPAAALAVLGRSHWLAHPACGALQQAVVAAAAAPIVPAPLVEYLEAQIQWLDNTHRMVRQLAELSQRLAERGGQGADVLLRIGEMVIDSVRPVSAYSHLLPLSGIGLDSLLDHDPRPWSGSETVLALQSARQLVWVLLSSGMWNRWLVEAATGAVLQNLGLTLLRHSESLAAAGRAHVRQVWEQHPAVGAAILGGVRHVPPLVLALVAQHHERCDGSGTPRGLRTGALSGVVRLLGVCVRFQDLRLALSRSDDAMLPGLLPNEHAAAQLWREAEAGLWDRDWALEMLESCLGKAAAMQVRELPVPLTEVAEPHGWHLHGAELEPAPPHGAPARSGRQTVRTPG